MRKYVSSLLLIGFSLLIMVSCNKEESIEVIKPEPEAIKDYIFLNQKLKQLAIVLGPLIKNPSFRSIIINKVNQKFDEEYEMLIKDIFSDESIKSVVSYSKIEKIHTDLYERSGIHLYPQIYIPMYQYLEDNNRNAARTSTEEEPVLVFYSGNPDVDSSHNETLPGYKLVNDELVYFTMVNEEYANEHEVWVFNINEVVDEEGRIIPSSWMKIQKVMEEHQRVVMTTIRKMHPVSLSLFLN